MSSMMRIVTCVGLLLCLTSNANSVRLDIIPDGFVEGITDSVLITCSLDGTGTKATQILVAEISKDEEKDKPLAHIMPPNNIELGDPKNGHYEVHGLANNSDISSTYLNLTIKYPSTGDAGVYKCLMSYIDDKGLVTQDTAQAELRINSTDQSNIDIRIKNLETALDHLLERIKDVEKVNDNLKEENKNQTSQIEVLREKLDLAVGFSAAVSKEKTIATGEVLVFSDVITNEGQGYNDTTGIFTAPKGGLYAFHLVVEVGQGGAVAEICLNVAGTDMAKLYTQDKDFGDQGAVSVVSRLKPGDTVKAVVLVVNGNNPRIFSERLCVFSGFLIKQ